jgi:hypothetical protein
MRSQKENKMFDFIQVPKDWDVVNVWEEKDPNKIGEALLHWAFVGRNGERGCYETFKLPDFFKRIGVSSNEYEKYFARANAFCYPDEGTILNCFIFDQPEIEDEYFHVKPLKLIIAWYWEGDGTLYFRLIGGEKDIEVINTDCKKSYRWEYVEDNDGTK